MLRWKSLLRLMLVLVTVGFVWIGLVQPATAHGLNFQADLAVANQSTIAPEKLCVDTGQKIDLNNANLMAFMDCPGFYPNLAQEIVQQGPYEQVEDVLNISGISNHQKHLLETNVDFFSVSTPVVPLEMRMPPRPSLRANP